MATVNAARLAKMTADTAGGGDYVKINYFKFDNPIMRVRFLPGQIPESLDKDFYVRTLLHYGAVPTNPKQFIICPKAKNPKAPCPACTEVAKLKASSSKIDEAEVTKIKAKPRFAIGVLPREGKQAGTICVWLAPKTIVQQIQAYMSNEEYGDITHATEGYDCRVTKKGDTRNIEYTIQAAKKETPIVDDEDQLKDLLADQPELWRFREAPDADEIQALIDGEPITVTTGGFGIGGTKTVQKKEEEPEEEEDNDDFTDADTPSFAESPAEHQDTVPATPAAPVVAPPAKKFSNLAALKEKINKN